ncbi:hypothetical protein ACFYTC_26440 [Actinomadura nitritigenes]|uniref:SCO2583/SCO2584 N-terminal domain-containing protein n=1 Tax=Actinomadura TaxID=1988 RepID=UPI001681F693|nr:hypothetical protein [Actinomadura sp. RB99]MBD2891920.1 hypothetical protein [Actinomadura sp. RB99]
MPAEFDEPVFDEEFVRNAAFTEPSARERAQPPRRTRRWRGAGRPAGRLRGRLGVRAWRARRRYRGEPSHRRAVIQVIGGVLVLVAISIALWWWQSGSRRSDDGNPVGPAATIIVSPLPSAPPAVSEIPRAAAPAVPSMPDVPAG